MSTERPFSSGQVECSCGRTFHLWWNGGELDEHLCACGLFYRIEHRQTVLTSRQLDPEDLATKRADCSHPVISAGVCQVCASEKR